jgi:hypothetical protein
MAAIFVSGDRVLVLKKLGPVLMVHCKADQLVPFAGACPCGPARIHSGLDYDLPLPLHQSLST